MLKVFGRFSGATLGLLIVLNLALPRHLIAPANAESPIVQPPVFSVADSLPDINSIFTLVNNERALQNLQPLQRHKELTKLAEARAQDMAVRQYYAHKNPDGNYFDDLLKESGTEVGFACENLDLAFTIIPQVYVSDWLGSSHGHRECLLDTNVTAAGYAVTEFKTSTATTTDMPTYVVVAIHAQL